MVQRKGGARRKTRSLFRKNIRQKGKVSLSKYLQKLELGQKVILKAEPAVQKGMYFKRFHGKIGEITGKKGACYEIKVLDRKKPKSVIVHPIHLKKV